MILYFIKEDNPNNYTTAELTLKRTAKPAAVIAGMENNGWKNVSKSDFDKFNKKQDS